MPATLSVDEDSGEYTSPVGDPWVTDISTGPANESTQNIDYFIVSNNNNTLFSEQPDILQDGTLTFTPADDKNGTAIVTVQIHDVR